MTHLFSSNHRYRTMDNSQQLDSALTKTNKADNLDKIKPVFFHYFEPAVNDCCMRIELEFGVQLGKNREKFSKDQYIKLLEYLRSVRKDIKQDYLLSVNALFGDSRAENDRNKQPDFAKVALLSHEVVKENHVITQIIRQCEQSFYEELTGLNKHLALRQGKQTITDSQNPIFPDKLLRALADVVNPLKLNTDSKIALYKSFDAGVFSQLGFIYRELIKWCETAAPAQLHSVSEDKQQPEPAGAVEQASAEFTLLQQKLERWRSLHSDSAYGLASVAAGDFYEHFEIKNALQILQQLSDNRVPTANKPPLKARVLKQLEELSFNHKLRYLAKQDEDTLDLTALFFSRIERTELLPKTVKTVVLQLETPLAAISLGQVRLFTDPNSPLRQLLDDVFAAGMFLNADELDDRLIQERIAGAVKKITRNGADELSVWITEAGEFSTYLNKQKQRSRTIEDNTRQLMRDKQVQESSRKTVAIALENSMKGKALPAAIAEFLSEVWSKVLLDAYAHQDEQPEHWQKSVQAMDELIVSVMPPADEHARKQILKLLPGLIAELRNGLKQIAYDKSAQSRFFKDLAVWHIILMDKKAKPLDAKDNAVLVEEKVEAISDDSATQAENMALESWFAFTTASGKQWAKLLWKEAENLLFVGKNGVKMFEIETAELAKKLRLRQAVMVKINEQSLTERVLTELMKL